MRIFIVSFICCLTFSVFHAQETNEKETSDISFEVIDEAPVFKGCEGIMDNEIRKDCMSKRVSSHVAQNFNLSIASDLGIIGKNRISVQFKIDKEGNIVDVKARASHPQLEAEAIRVVEIMPSAIKPGLNNGKPVGVLYSLPIAFQIKETAKEKRKRLRRERNDN